MNEYFHSALPYHSLELREKALAICSVTFHMKFLDDVIGLIVARCLGVDKKDVH